MPPALRHHNSRDALPQRNPAIASSNPRRVRALANAERSPQGMSLRTQQPQEGHFSRRFSVHIHDTPFLFKEIPHKRLLERMNAPPKQSQACGRRLARPQDQIHHGWFLSYPRVRVLLPDAVPVRLRRSLVMALNTSPPAALVVPPSAPPVGSHVVWGRYGVCLLFSRSSAIGYGAETCRVPVPSWRRSCWSIQLHDHPADDP
ncbi:hypothetical protein R3P38DRAFT_501902 [Favolaschia claudopus]|uniref:Uncharacterized protein n=1 Tax=Favolaschia claudopus TaxID=2862362 RepID=A0AAV9ZDU2_9AGAR